MLALSSLDLPPPRNWQGFEDLCCDLWRRIWNDPETQKNGRSGQSQAGVDIFGRPERAGKWAGVQCKLRTGPHGLSRKDLEHEIEQARGRLVSGGAEAMLAERARRRPGTRPRMRTCEQVALVRGRPVEAAADAL